MQCIDGETFNVKKDTQITVHMHAKTLWLFDSAVLTHRLSWLSDKQCGHASCMPWLPDVLQMFPHAFMHMDVDSGLVQFPREFSD